MREYEGVWVPDLSPLPSRNRRLDLDSADFAECVVAVAAPGPVFGLFDESTMDGIAVDVLEFLDALRWGEDIEVVVTGLPESPVGRFDFLGDGLLQCLDGASKSCAFRFAKEQVDVFRHHDVADHVEPITAPGLFERAFEDILRAGCVEEGLPPVTSEGDEVETLGLLETNKSPRHGVRLDVLEVVGL